MLDGALNWLLDRVDDGLGLWPSWSPTLPDLSGITNPLAQVNWLIAIDVPWGIALAMLLLGPAFLLVTLTLWVIGLFTPTATTR